MSGIIRHSIAAGALFVSPGGVNVGATLEAPPAIYAPIQDPFRARRPEEDASGGLTLEQLLAMAAISELSLTPKVAERRQFPRSVSDRIRGSVAVAGQYARIKQPSKYSNGKGIKPTEARASRRGPLGW